MQAATERSTGLRYRYRLNSSKQLSANCNNAREHALYTFATGAAVPPREEGSADCHSARARAIFALLYRKMKKDLEELLSAERFSPFVVTANDGFSIAVDSPKRCLVGARMLGVSAAEVN